MEATKTKQRTDTEHSNLLYGTLVWKLANNWQYAAILLSMETLGFSQKQVDTAIDIITNCAGRWRD